MPARAGRLSASVFPKGCLRSWAGVVFICAAWLPASASCQIFVNADWPGGAVVLSNFKSDQAAVVLVADQNPAAAGAEATSSSTPRQPLATSALASVELRQVVDRVAEKTAVSPRLIHAVILAESRYDPKAVSVKGAIGLMQLLPETARRFGAVDPFSIEQNVSAGANYLKWLMGLFGNDLELVLAAYNAGEQAVIKAGRQVPPYAETKAYVKRIMADLRRAPTLAM